MNSPGWTDDSHVLVGMGWISNTTWFIAQPFVEQLHLGSLAMPRVLVVIYSLVPSMIGFLCQSHGALHCGVQNNHTTSMPSQHWMCFQFSLVSSIHASHSKLICSGSVVSAQCQPQPWGRWLKVWGLSCWCELLSLAGMSAGHDLCYCPCVPPEVGCAQVQWKLAFYLHAFPRHFQETELSKTWCDHDHRVITVPLKLYWVYRYMNLCLSVNPTVFSGLKAARHFLYLLLRADVPNSNHVLLKNVRVGRGRMVNAFQSQLLFPPLNCRSRETTVVNRDLKNIQIFYRSKPLLCAFFCLLLVLKTTLSVLLHHPGTGADPLSKYSN